MLEELKSVRMGPEKVSSTLALCSCSMRIDCTKKSPVLRMVINLSSMLPMMANATVRVPGVRSDRNKIVGLNGDTKSRSILRSAG